MEIWIAIVEYREGVKVHSMKIETYSELGKELTKIKKDTNFVRFIKVKEVGSLI